MAETMKTMYFTKFGPPEVLSMKNMDIPKIEDDEILVRNYATSMNTVDIVFRSGSKAIFGLTRLSTGIRGPRKNILGWDIAGEVVEVGSLVNNFSKGDRVYGGTTSGGNAEFCITKEKIIAKLPDGISYNDGAALPMVALTALQAVRDTGNIEKDQDVLIYGASGGIGSIAVQLAKYFGAHVTGIASGKNREFVLGLGADDFVDYKTEDFTIRQATYDLIIDAVGKIPDSKWKKSLKPAGVFVDIGSPQMSLLWLMGRMMTNVFRSKKYLILDTKYKDENLEFIVQLVQEGHIKPQIEKTYTLDKLPEAHHHYEKGRTVGKIVIEI